MTSFSNSQRNNRSSFVRLFLSLLFMMGLVFGLNTQTVHADDGGDFSLYARSSEVMKAFGNALAPSSGGTSNLLTVAGANTGIWPGQAGGLLGYADVNADDEGVIGWLTSAVSNSSATFTYDQLDKITRPSGTAVTHLRSYGYYGKALKVMGLDDTKSGSNAGFVRFTTGWLFVGLYYLSTLVPSLMYFAIKFLQIINPFSMFAAASSWSSEQNGVFGKVFTFVNTFYVNLQDMSWALLPIFLATMIFSVFMFRKTSGTKKIWRYVLRVFVILGAVPLIGGTYTGMLNSLADDSSSSSKYADYIIASTFVDFEGWAKNTRLMPPNNNLRGSSEPTAIRVNKNGKVLSLTPSRPMILQINKFSTSALSTIGVSNSNESAWNIAAKASETDTTQSASNYVQDLLVRYARGERYTAADYEGFVKADITELASGKKTDDLAKMFELSAKDLGDGKAQGLFGDTGSADKTYNFGNKYNSSSIYNNGGLRWSDSTLVFHQEESGTPTLVDGKVIGSVGSNTRGGLSPLAMYNFLNTDFNERSMTVYSSNKASSDFVRKTHFSVNAAGSGLMGFFNLVIAIVIMLCLVVLAVFFGVSLISVAFKSIVPIMVGVFGTTMGGLGSFAKLAISTLVLMAEILGTIFLYALSENMIVSILAGMDDLLAWAGLNTGGAAAVMWILQTIFAGLISVITVYFMIRNRSKLVKIVDDLAATAIQRLMGGLDNVVNSDNVFRDSRDIENNSKSARNALADAGAGVTAAEGHKVKESGVKQALRGAAEENSRISDLYKRAGVKQSIGSRVNNVAEGASRRYAAGVKDAALGVLGFEGHNVDNENDYSKAKIEAVERQFRDDMQRDAADDISRAMGFGSGIGDSFDPGDFDGFDGPDPNDDPNDPNGSGGGVAGAVAGQAVHSSGQNSETTNQGSSGNRNNQFDSSDGSDFKGDAQMADRQQLNSGMKKAVQSGVGLNDDNELLNQGVPVDAYGQVSKEEQDTYFDSLEQSEPSFDPNAEPQDGRQPVYTEFGGVGDIGLANSMTIDKDQEFFDNSDPNAFADPSNPSSQGVHGANSNGTRRNGGRKNGGAKKTGSGSQSSQVRGENASRSKLQENGQKLADGLTQENLDNAKEIVEAGGSGAAMAGPVGAAAGMGVAYGKQRLAGKHQNNGNGQANQHGQAQGGTMPNFADVDQFTASDAVNKMRRQGAGSDVSQLNQLDADEYTGQELNGVPLNPPRDSRGSMRQEQQRQVNGLKGNQTSLQQRGAQTQAQRQSNDNQQTPQNQRVNGLNGKNGHFDSPTGSDFVGDNDVRDYGQTQNGQAQLNRSAQAVQSTQQQTRQAPQGIEQATGNLFVRPNQSSNVQQQQRQAQGTQRRQFDAPDGSNFVGSEQTQGHRQSQQTQSQNVQSNGQSVQRDFVGNSPTSQQQSAEPTTRQAYRKEQKSQAIQQWSRPIQSTQQQQPKQKPDNRMTPKQAAKIAYGGAKRGFRQGFLGEYGAMSTVQQRKVSEDIHSDLQGKNMEKALAPAMNTMKQFGINSYDQLAPAYKAIDNELGYLHKQEQKVTASMKKKNRGSSDERRAALNQELNTIKQQAEMLNARKQTIKDNAHGLLQAKNAIRMQSYGVTTPQGFRGNPSQVRAQLSRLVDVQKRASDLQLNHGNKASGIAELEQLKAEQSLIKTQLTGAGLNVANLRNADEVIGFSQSFNKALNSFAEGNQKS